MKTTSVCALFLFLAAGLSAAVVEVPSKIESVTVYQGVAKVTRSYAVDLPAGSGATLRFSGLPASLDQSYVQVSVSEGAALTLGMVTCDSDFKEADKSPALLALEAKLRDLDTRRKALSGEREAALALARSRVALVDSINRGLAETGKPELIALSQNAYADAAAAVVTANASVAGIDEQLRLLVLDADAAREVLDKQMAREQATSLKYSVEAVSAGGHTKGTISYYVPSPSWTPSYIVRADTTKGTVAITYLAGISQNTGEDWNGVTLTLETSRPGAGAKPVEPSPIVLQQFTGPVYGRSASKSLDYFEASAAPAPPPPASAYNSVAVTSSLTGFRAEVKGIVSVLSSDNATVLTLMDRDIPTDFHTETIPLSAETAYLVGKAKNAFPLPILAGQMQAIVDGSTNGTGYFEETLPGDELTMGLGVNQNVVVERKVVTEKGKNSGIFGGRRVEERSYVNKITNNMSVPQRIVVRDRLPITRDDKIEVKLLQPAAAKPDTETGLFDQEITLQPGQSIELPTQFKVSYPGDWKITGGF